MRAPVPSRSITSAFPGRGAARSGAPQIRGPAFAKSLWALVQQRSISCCTAPGTRGLRLALSHITHSEL